MGTSGEVGGDQARLNGAPRRLHLLCAGASQGLVERLAAPFLSARGAALQARFGAVGMLKEALEGGAPCDLMVSTEVMIDTLCAQGRLLPGVRAAIGRVRTAVAVRAGDPRPEVSTPEALAAVLAAAPSIHFPDPQRATAGIHFAAVLRELGLHETLAPRLRPAPNGAAAMQALATEAAPGAVGCTQASEILRTPGVVLAGMLPARFELATVYGGALGADAREPVLAAELLALLTGPAGRGARRECGIEEAA